MTKKNKIMAEPKFAIGDFVTLAESDEAAIKIVGILIDVCPGGIQIHYSGKGYRKERVFGFEGKEFHWQWINKHDRFNEVELGKVVKDAI